MENRAIVLSWGGERGILMAWFMELTLGLCFTGSSVSHSVVGSSLIGAGDILAGRQVYRRDELQNAT